MMRGQQVSDLQLSGFVDGELPAADAASVAEAVARDPALAQRVARLHRMKAALQGYPDSLPLPDPLPPTQRGRAPAIVSRLVAAAALVLVLLWPGAPPQQTDTPMARLAQHDYWLHSKGPAIMQDLPPELVWMAEPVRASGLQLVHYQADMAQTHLGFRGRSDCRLSLFISQATMPADAPLRLTLSDSVQHALWRTQGYSFEMVARDMAPARFATLSTALKQGSGAHGDAGNLHVALLGAARLPCIS